MSAKSMQEAPDSLGLWLVDDNRPFCKVLTRLLRDQYHVACGGVYHSAEAMIRALEAGAKPEAILLDLKLPGMDGVQALPAIKHLSPRTAVFIFSTFMDVTKSDEAQRAGADGYFAKHHPMDRVVAALRRAVEEHRLPISEK